MELIEDYFNDVLKKYLNYPETFKIYLSINRIVLIPDLNSLLLEMIKNNPKFKNELIIKITELLNKIYSKNVSMYPTNITDVYLSTHGTDIVINYTISENITNLPAELYATTASYLNDQEIEKFYKALNLTDEQSYYQIILRNKLGPVADKFVGNQKDYFELYYYFTTIDDHIIYAWDDIPGINKGVKNLYQLDDISLIYLDRLKYFNKKYPKEFRLYVSYMNMENHSDDIISLLSPINDLDVIKYIWDKSPDKLHIHEYMILVEQMKSNINLFMEDLRDPLNAWRHAATKKYMDYTKMRLQAYENIITMMKHFNLE